MLGISCVEIIEVQQKSLILIELYWKKSLEVSKSYVAMIVKLGPQLCNIAKVWCFVYLLHPIVPGSKFQYPWPLKQLRNGTIIVSFPFYTETEFLSSWNSRDRLTTSTKLISFFSLYNFLFNYFSVTYWYFALYYFSSLFNLNFLYSSLILNTIDTCTFLHGLNVHGILRYTSIVTWVSAFNVHFRRYQRLKYQWYWIPTWRVDSSLFMNIIEVLV